MNLVVDFEGCKMVELPIRDVRLWSRFVVLFDVQLASKPRQPTFGVESRPGGGDGVPRGDPRL